MLVIEASPTFSDVPSPSPSFSVRSNSIDLVPARLYTADQIGMYDVLCGRDKAAFNNIGNRRFRVTVSLSLERYLQAATRKEKSVVIKSVVTMLHADGGKFLQLVTSKRSNSDAPCYIELNEKQAHEKAGHALRDMALLRSKTSSTTSSKKSKATDQPLIDSTITTATTATSISSSMVSSNKKVKRNQHENLSAVAHIQEHLLPRQLDSWTELTWDESSELTLDEAMFDNLVQSVAANTDNVPTNPTGMMIMNDSMTNQLCTNDVVPIGTMDVDHISSTVSEMMNNKSSTHDTERASSASFTLDDEMVSWLVGESDFVLQV